MVYAGARSAPGNGVRRASGIKVVIGAWLLVAPFLLQSADASHWNDLSAGIRAKYLVLCNVDILHRDGAWHYIFEFDARNSLEMSELAYDSRFASWNFRSPSSPSHWPLARTTLVSTEPGVATS